MSAQQKPEVPPSIVSSIETQLDEKRRSRRDRIVGQQTDHAGPAADAHRASPLPADAEARRLKGKLTSDWRLVRRARFNAAKRLRNRYEAGQFAFAVSGIYGFLVPLFLLQFDGYLSNFAGMVISGIIYLTEWAKSPIFKT